ncbi:MAG: hypothetical protein ACRCXD_00085 [Luteolibacter sp.]
MPVSFSFVEVLIISGFFGIVGVCLGALAAIIFVSKDPKVRVMRPEETVILRTDLDDLVLHVPQALKMKWLQAQATPPDLKEAIKKEFSRN